MAARKTSLRAVAPDEKPAPAPKVFSSTEDAASNGATRDVLVKMRGVIAKAVDNPNTPARELAALTKRLVEVIRDIEAIDAREKQEASKSAAETPDSEFDSEAI